MSDTSRKKAIENLETLKAFLDINGVFTISDAMKKSIDFAIASLKTDEAYQLEYERTTKNDLAVSSGLENGSPIIDWNNCHTSEQLDSIATPKNDLGVDCISRFEVTEILNSEYDIDKMLDRVDDLPSVTPIRPKGHWIEQIDHEENCRTLICSNCDRPALHDGDSIWKHKFCPHCGADMREVEE